MKNKVHRIVYVIAALTIGYGMVYALSKISRETKGPIETVLENAEVAVQDVEKTIIVEQREETRDMKLVWFKKERENKNMLINSRVVLFGASDESQKESYENIIDLEHSLGQNFPIIHIYKAWGDKPEEDFPERDLKAIHNIGSVPMVTWEPWVTDFSQENFPNLPPVSAREKGAMAAVAKGDYDSFLKKWALAAKNFGHPFYLRPGHEMNEPYRYPWGPQNDSPQDFVAAWKHIHDVFDAAGATNVIWVWSPHTAYGYLADYYPGNNYVDVIASGVLNYGTATSWSQWWSFDEIFSNFYSEVAGYNKPIMIAEFGSLKTGGDRAQWFGNALKNLKTRYPLVNALVFFHYPGDKTVADKAVNWYIKDDKKVTSEIKKQVNAWAPTLKAPSK